MNSTIKPAATVVVLREHIHELQVLLLRRNPALAFAPDTWVFPGGKVEQEELAQADGNLDTANRLAAVRECAEETGLLLELASLIPISHWTTPDLRPKRYATQFFVSYLSEAQEVTIDNSEIVEFCWLNPQAAIDRHAQGALTIMAPTLVTLSELAKLEDYAEVKNYYRSRPQRTYNPRLKLESRSEGTFLYEGDSGYQQVNPDHRETLNRCEMSGGVIKHLCDLD